MTKMEVDIEVKQSGLDKFVNELQKKFTNMFAKLGGSLGSVGGKGKAGGGALDALVNIGTKAIGMLAVVTVIVGAVKDMVMPILDQIGVMIQLFVLPFAMVLQSLLKPVLKLLIKFIMPLIGPLKSSPGRNKLPEGNQGGVSGFIGGQGTPGQPGAAGGAGGAGGVITTVINPTINAIGDGFQRLGAAFDGLFNTGDMIEDLVIQGMDTIGAFVGEFVRRVSAVWWSMTTAWDWLNKMFADIMKLDFLSALKDLGMVVASIVKAFWEGIMAGLQILFAQLGPVGIFVWNTLIKPLMTLIYEALVGAGTFVWENVIVPLATAMWNALNGAGLALRAKIDEIWQWVQDQLKGGPLNLAAAIFNGFAGIINSAVSKASEMIANLGKGVGETAAKIGNAIGIHDAVVTPAGQVIKTDPADYLFATKNPQNLARGGGGSTFNVTINNPVVDSEARIQQLLDTFERRIEMNIKRGGNYATGI